MLNEDAILRVLGVALAIYYGVGITVVVLVAVGHLIARRKAGGDP